jgi:hypothetical protein
MDCGPYLDKRETQPALIATSSRVCLPLLTTDTVSYLKHWRDTELEGVRGRLWHARSATAGSGGGSSRCCWWRQRLDSQWAEQYAAAAGSQLGKTMQQQWRAAQGGGGLQRRHKYCATMVGEPVQSVVHKIICGC